MPRHRRVAALAGCLLPLLTAASAAHTQELRYSLTPTAQWVRWDDALGLDDAYLYGGRAGFTFGQFVELQGFYLTRGRIDQRLGVDIGLPESPESTLGIRNYGVDFVANLSPTRLKPFLKAGGSILRFAPEGAEATRQIALRAGGGIRFGNPGQLRLQLYAEDLMFRVDRARLRGLPPGSDPEANDLRHNLVYGAGLTIPLGGATSGDDAPRFSLSNLSLPVEVFGGVFNFDDELDFDGQNLVGVRTGVNFGPLVGLRGYYWRGVNDGFSGTTGIQSYGGEAQFRLNAGSGLNPYLVAGAGQLDFLDDFEGAVPEGAAPGVTPDDRVMLILGGGVGLELTERLRLDVAARNHLFNAAGEIEDVRRADDLQSNWLLSAGLGFNIGGTTADERPQPRVPVVARVDTVVVDRETGAVVREARGAERGEVRDTARVAMTSRGDSLRVALDSVRASRDSLARELRAGTSVTRGGDVAPTSRGYAGERMVQIPVPTEGELYVRYGPAGDSARRTGPGGAALSDDELTRQAVRDILREELARTDRPADTLLRSDPAARELLERRLLDRVDSVIAARARLTRPDAALAPAATTSDVERQQLLDDIADIVRTQVQDEMARQRALRPAPAPPTVVVPPPVVERTVVTPAQPAPSPQPAQPSRLLPRSFSLYTGLNVNEGAQWVLGGRINVGPFLNNFPRLALVPEFALGLGDGTTSLIAANGQYRLAPFDIANFGLLGLYGQLGLGAYIGTLEGDRQLDLVINPAYGLEFTIDDVRRLAGTSLLFAEHQGVDFFKRNRFVVGLRWAY